MLVRETYTERKIEITLSEREAEWLLGLLQAIDPNHTIPIKSEPLLTTTREPLIWANKFVQALQAQKIDHRFPSFLRFQLVAIGPQGPN